MTKKVIRYVHTEDIHNIKAASVLVPFVINLTNPKSVLDIGCGTGTWLKIFEQNGIYDIYGLDGEYVDISKLCISTSKFASVDLRSSIDLKRKFDVLLCLEVAEHIEENYAVELINTLERHGDTIIFSAAIPSQGGQNHVNEQQPEYWSLKFESFGYKFIDVIRPSFWQNTDIDWWYRQNIFVVTRDKALLEKYSNYIGNNMYIHPELYNSKVKKIEEWQFGYHSPRTYLTLLLKSIERRVLRNKKFS